MSHPIHRVQSFEIVGCYTLKVQFEDGVAQTIDFRPVLEGELYGPLRDPALFKKVQIDPEVHTLVWPNGADFDPATLHDWPQLVEHFVAMVRRWSESPSESQDRAG
ncbi:DUF2442 domain-containing protein [Acidobacteria bacterium AH-259-L09]|nr:DUF2442 domain-containing protein [Acidobacteria bacterium AH-259-L09]